MMITDEKYVVRNRDECIPFMVYRVRKKQRKKLDLSAAIRVS